MALVVMAGGRKQAYGVFPSVRKPRITLSEPVNFSTLRVACRPQQGWSFGGARGQSLIRPQLHTAIMPRRAVWW